MSAWIDIKYINLISYRLQNFKWVRTGKVCNFSCPVCGDSATDKAKARGYGLLSPEMTTICCHNCGLSISFSRFLEDYFPLDYHEYRLEVFAEKGLSNHKPEESFVIDATPKFAPKEFLELHSIRVDKLDPSHLAAKYVVGRKINYKDLWYTDSFRDLVDKFDAGYDAQGIPDEPRLIIPYRNSDRSLSGFQGRALIKSRLRYITIKKSTNSDIIFGLDRVDFSRTVFVLEGALDSTFIPNSIAVNGSSLQRLDNLFTKEQTDKMIFCWDAEPRNRQIVENMKLMLGRGHRVVVWSRDVPKDINQMILSGMTKVELAELLRSSVCSGPIGLLRLSKWRRD